MNFFNTGVNLYFNPKFIGALNNLPTHSNVNKLIIELLTAGSATLNEQQQNPKKNVQITKYGNVNVYTDSNTITTKDLKNIEGPFSKIVALYASILAPKKSEEYFDIELSKGSKTKLSKSKISLYIDELNKEIGSEIILFVLATVDHKLTQAEIKQYFNEHLKDNLTVNVVVKSLKNQELVKAFENNNGTNSLATSQLIGELLLRITDEILTSIWSYLNSDTKKAIIETHLDNNIFFRSSFQSIELKNLLTGYDAAKIKTLIPVLISANSNSQQQSVSASSSLGSSTSLVVKADKTPIVLFKSIINKSIVENYVSGNIQKARKLAFNWSQLYREEIPQTVVSQSSSSSSNSSGNLQNESEIKDEDTKKYVNPDKKIGNEASTLWHLINEITASEDMIKSAVFIALTKASEIEMKSLVSMMIYNKFRQWRFNSSKLLNDIATIVANNETFVYNLGRIIVWVLMENFDLPTLEEYSTENIAVKKFAK